MKLPLFRLRHSPRAVAQFGVEIPPAPPSATIVTDRLVGPALSSADIATLDTVLTYVVSQVDQAMQALHVTESTFNLLHREAARDRLKKVMIELSAFREGPLLDVGRSGIPPVVSRLLAQRKAQDDRLAAND